MRFVLLLLVFFVWFVDGCGLACFLANLTVNLPPVQKGKSGLSNLVCSDLELLGLSSSSSPRVLSLSVDQLALSCQADWVLHEIVPLGHGTMAFRVDLTVAFGLTFSSFDGRFPSVVNASNITNSFSFSKFVIDAANPIEDWVVHRLENFTKNEVAKQLDKSNIGIVQDIAGAISSNLAALSQVLSAPVLPLETPIFARRDHHVLLTNSTPVIRLLDFLLNTAIGIDGPLNINFLLQSFLRNSTSLNLGALLGNKTIELAESIAGIASIDVSVLGGYLTGIDTFDLFQLLVPVSENFFSSQVRLGELALSNFTFGLDFQFATGNSVVQDPAELTELIALDLALSDFGVNFSNLVLISSDLELRGPQYLDVGCVGPAVENATVGALNVGGSMRNIFLERRSNDALDQQVGELLNNFFAAINDAYPQFVPGLVALVVRDPLVSQINGLVDSLMRGGQSGNLSSCQLYSEEQNGFWAEFPLPFIATVASMACAGGLAVLLAIVACVFGAGKRSGSSLFMSPAALWWLRVLIPAALFFSLATFVVVMCGTTGFSTILLTFNLTEINPPPVFLFNLPNLLIDAFDAKAWANVIGLSVLGMFWMFARQVLVLLVFFMPSFKHRVAVVEFLDLFGKWVGFFFLEAMLIPVAFRLHVEPVPDVSIDLLTSGAGAYFLYILGLFVSLVAGNLVSVLACRQHKNVQDDFLDSSGDLVVNSSEPRSWLGGHTFVLHNRRVRLKVWAKVVMSIFVLACLGLTAAAIFIDSVAFTMTGLASKLLPLTGTPLIRSFSILSVVTKYGTIVRHISWMYVSQVCLFMTCVFFPLLCCLSFLALWFIPLRDSGRASMVRAVMILRSWNFLEVYAGALLACTLSISLIGTFMVQDQCQLINQLLVAYFSVQLGNQTFCFDVDTAPLLGFWLMLGAAVLTFVTGHVLVLLARTSEAHFSVTSTEEELELLSKQKRKSSWLEVITEQVDPKAFRTDLN